MKVVSSILSKFIEKKISGKNFLVDIDINSAIKDELYRLSNSILDFLYVNNYSDEVFDEIVKDLSNLNRREDRLSIICFFVDYLIFDGEENLQWRKMLQFFRKDMEYISNL